MADYMILTMMETDDLTDSAETLETNMPACSDLDVFASYQVRV